MDEPTTPARPGRDVLTTLARWGRERGDVAVCNRLTGEVVVIDYGDLTPIWKIDLARERRGRHERRDD